MSKGERDLTYSNYLQIDQLLSLQQPLSDPPAHDELQFIIVHQVYELWFRLINAETEAIIEHLQDGSIQNAIWLFRRLIEIERVMSQQLQVLETMSPAKFLEFRDLLKPASGFQSVQFRKLEALSGLDIDKHLAVFDDQPEAQKELREAADGPNLWTAFVSLLERRGFDISTNEAVLESLVAIYENTSFLDLHQLCEEMVEYDEGFRSWRARHALMAERMIGSKHGTGTAHTAKIVGDESFQEPGVRYLRGRIDLKFFPLLWEVRTLLPDK